MFQRRVNEGVWQLLDVEMLNIILFKLGEYRTETQQERTIESKKVNRE